MKRKIILSGLILSFLSLITAGTLAFFTAEEKAVNVITSGNIDIELLETTEQSEDGGNRMPTSGLYGVMPGSITSMVAAVKNTGEKPAYVRVKVDISIQMENGTVLDGEDSSLIFIDINHEDWTLLEDDYYYYNERLKSGAITKQLFTQVAFSETMGNDFQNSVAMVGVRASAVQSENNGETVFDALGWPEESVFDN